MTVYRRGRVYYYDFWWQGTRYHRSTKQRVEQDAVLVESQLKLRLRREAGGVAILDPKESPRIAEWAGVYYEHAARLVTRPERIDDLLRVVLRFWGEAEASRVAGAPYHDLHLLDPIVDPMWIEKFERWITDRAKAGQTRNQYRSVMSQMYVLAMAPAYRNLTGVRFNPFVGVPRDRTTERTSTITLDELRAWLSAASYHVRLAIAIAALAPKLRLRNVLALRWDDIDRKFERIIIERHKTARYTQRPLVAPINAQLRAILQDAKRRHPVSTYVVTYRGKPVVSIRGGLQLAVKRAARTPEGANLHYGRFRGVTFHTIRHTMATILAELGEGESLRKEVMGHERLETTQRYTHIRPTHQLAALERLSAATPIGDVVMLPWRRASNKTGVGTTAETASTTASDCSEKRRNRPDSTEDGD